MKNGYERYNFKLKSRNDGTVELTTYAKDIYVGITREKSKEKREKSEEEIIQCDDDNARRSIGRTRTSIKDIAYAGTWELFITITFDKQKVDRYNFDEIQVKYSKLLENLKRRHIPDLEYVMVPERHKDGAYHFHALFRGCGGLVLEPARNPQGRLIKSKGQQVYNMPQFNLGHNTATYVVDSGKAASYLVKYITKDLISDLKGRKKYWATKGIKKVESEKGYQENEGMEKTIFDLQMQKKIVASTTTLINNNGYENVINTYIIKA